MVKGKKEKKEIKIPCFYCEHFLCAPAVYSSGLRFCRSVGQNISHQQDSCSLFKKPEYFWCFKEEHRVSLILCVERRKHKTCKSCLQSKIIDKIQEREINIPKTSWRKKVPI